MDYKVIINLMKEMNNTDLTKLEIEEEGLKIRIEKTVPEVNVVQSSAPGMAYAPGNFAASYMPAAPVLQQTNVQPSMSENQAITENAEKSSEDANCKKLVSPMVGTFYSSSAPDKAPFAKVGDKVKKGQTICIIEAMKLLNEIESEHDGEIVKILVNNEEMVEYGQPLFLIK